MLRYLIMNKQIIKNKLSEKLKFVERTIKSEIQNLNDNDKSPYFSPRQTRKQRRIKIEYENDIKRGGTPSVAKEAIKLKSESEESELEALPIATIISANSILKNEKGKLINYYKKSSEENNPFTPSSEIEVKKRKTETWIPQNWEQVLKNLQLMRSDFSAPVDTMGCHKCSDEDADDKTKRYHILVALMLSSQTKDKVTFDAMNRLKKLNLQPKTIVEIESEKLEILLNPVSFYKNKAKYLKKTASILIEKYNSDIPKTVEELIKLPGVGPKMAHICMNSAWNIVTGIGVDVHVHRISNRLGWVRRPTKEPEKTRLALESWLPSELWGEVNHMLVGFGQTICTPINPKCGDCLNRDICPSANIPTTNSEKQKI